MTTGSALRLVNTVTRRWRSRGVAPKPGGLDLGYLHGLLGDDVRIILEIGANDGSDTLRLLDEFPHATVHCFEPDPRARAAITAQVRSDRAHIHPIAVGSSDGTATFFQSSGAPPGREAEFPDGWHLSGSIRRPKEHLAVHEWCRFDTEIEVEMRTLDSWAAEAKVGPVDFIWADVQGAEADLIAGGASLLRTTRFLYTEYNDAELYEGQANLAALRSLLPGWRVRELYVDDVLFENVGLRTSSRHA